MMQNLPLRSLKKIAIKHAQFSASGFIFGSSVTTNYQTVLSMEDDADVLLIASSLDQPFYISIPNVGGSVDLLFPPNCSIAIDLKTNNKVIAKGLIKAKAYSTLPTSTGLLTITAIR